MFSFLFMILSFFYYQIACASSQKINKENKQINQVKVQQKKIINSLRKIESRMKINNVTNR